MGKVTRAKRTKSFEPSRSDQKIWQSLPKERAKCLEMWKIVLATDAAVEKLCMGSGGEYKYDPIAMIIACMQDLEKFKETDNPVWKACYLAADAQLSFQRYMLHISKKFKFDFMLVRQTCNAIKSADVI